MVMLEGRYGGKEIVSSPFDEESPKGMEQMNDAKPPRHLSVIRHCASTARLVDSSEQVRKFLVFSFMDSDCLL